MQISVSINKFLGNTVMPFYSHIPFGCLCVTTPEWSGCHGNQKATKTKIFIIWPFTKKSAEA